MMTCDRAFTSYLELDKNERVPFRVTLHLLACPACRTGVRRLSRAERVLAAPLAVPAQGALRSAVGDDAVLSAMQRIRAAGLAYPDTRDDEGRVSLSRWIGSGFALGAGFAIIPFSSIGEWSRVTFGASFSIPLYLLCGIAVTVWCGVFIGSNIDFFVKKFHIDQVA